MAKELGLAMPTIRFHLRNLHKKLGTSDKVDIVLRIWRSVPEWSAAVGSSVSRLAQSCDLTNREAQIAELICKGMKNGSIATTLGLAIPTIRFHLRNLHKKLQTADKVDIVLKAWMATSR